MPCEVIVFISEMMGGLFPLFSMTTRINFSKVTTCYFSHKNVKYKKI